MKKKRFLLPTIFTTICLALLIFIRVSPSIAESDSFAIYGRMIAAILGIIGGLIGIAKYYGEMLENDDNDEVPNDKGDNEMIPPNDYEEAEPTGNISLKSHKNADKTES